MGRTDGACRAIGTNDARQTEAYGVIRDRPFDAWSRARHDPANAPVEAVNEMLEEKASGLASKSGLFSTLLFRICPGYSYKETGNGDLCYQRCGIQ